MGARLSLDDAEAICHFQHLLMQSLFRTENVSCHALCCKGSRSLVGRRAKSVVVFLLSTYCLSYLNIPLSAMLVFDPYSPTTQIDLPSLFVVATSCPMMSELDCSLPRQTFSVADGFPDYVQ